MATFDNNPNAYGHIPRTGERGVYVRTHNALSMLATLEAIPVTITGEKFGKCHWLFVEELYGERRSWRVKAHNVRGRADAYRWHPEAAARAWEEEESDASG